MADCDGCGSWELQVIEETNHTHSRDYEVFWTWMFVGIVLASLILFFGVKQWCMRRKVARPEEDEDVEEELDAEDLEIVSMFRLVNLSQYGGHTSALLLDALGICLADAIGNAMEVSIRSQEHGAFNIKHTLVFCAMVLSIGFGILHVTEFVRVRLKPQEDKQESFNDSMVRFLLVLSSRACSYLGGFVVQLAMAEWVIETHAEYMLGPERAHEALALAEPADKEVLSMSPIPNLDTVAVPQHVAHHALVALKSRVLNGTLHNNLHDVHNATVAAVHHVSSTAENFKNATLSFIHDEHVRFEFTLVVTFALCALVITVLGVGLVMFTQMLSDKYEARLVDWKEAKKNEEAASGHQH